MCWGVLLSVKQAGRRARGSGLDNMQGAKLYGVRARHKHFDIVLKLIVEWNSTVEFSCVNGLRESESNEVFVRNCIVTYFSKPVICNH